MIEDQIIDEEQLSDREYNALLRMKITLGDKAKAFMESDLGLYIQDKARMDEAAAIQKLRIVDPDDTKAVRKAQNDAEIPGMAVYWLLDAINQRDDILLENESQDDADTIDFEEREE
jgi:hypothetical protein